MNALTKFAAAAVLASGVTAPAVAAEFIGDYTINANIGNASGNNGLTVLTKDIADFSVNGFDLTNAGDSYSTPLFLIYTNETDVGGDDLNGRQITVNFAFTAPSVFGGNVNGTTVGQSFLGIYENGYVNWAGNGSTLLDFGNGGQLRITLFNTKFNEGFFGLNDGKKYGGVVDAKFKLVTAPVPEPATWAMMIAGFGLVGAAMRRRQTMTVTYA
jgi:hypothetical protein